jgi:signal peptidase II
MTLISVLVASAVVAADQATKSLAVHYLARRPVQLVGSTLELSLSYNRGFAFGLGQGLAPELAVLAAVLAVAMAVLARSAPTVPAAVFVGLILGGAVGNLADRLLRGHQGAVVDFVHTSFWPTFNLADSAIVVGTVLLVGRAALGRPH